MGARGRTRLAWLCSRPACARSAPSRTPTRGRTRTKTVPTPFPAPPLRCHSPVMVYLACYGRQGRRRGQSLLLGDRVGGLPVGIRYPQIREFRGRFFLQGRVVVRRRRRDDLLQGAGRGRRDRRGQGAPRRLERLARVGTVEQADPH